jgi:peptide/nickel transport system substrate-binding protein
VRIHTNAPAPDLPTDLDGVAILPRSTGVARRDAFTDGHLAIGTGPFRLAAYATDSQMDLTRNPDWWDHAPDMDRVTLRFIPSNAARAAALLAGDIDVMERVDPADLKALTANPNIIVTSSPSMQSIIIHMNFARPDGGASITDNDGGPLPVNPLRDLRVRQALSAAINREVLTQKLLAGMATASGQFAPGGVFGYAEDVAVPEYSPAMAREKLTEAGFPNGFRVVLSAPSDHLPGGTAVAEAIAQMWTHIGVATRLETMPWTAYSPRIARGEFALAVYPCCGSTSDAGSALFTVLGTRDNALRRGNTNDGGYSNPSLDALLGRAMTTFDPVAREDLQRQAARLAASDIGVIPLFHPINVWASRRPISYTPRVDDRSPANGARVTP